MLDTARVLSGACMDIIWGMSGACLEHNLGHVWAVQDIRGDACISDPVFYLSQYYNTVIIAVI